MLWLLVLLPVLVLVFRKILRPPYYWKERNVPCVTPWPVIGNMAEFIFRVKPWANSLQGFYNQFTGKRYFGFMEFSRPTLVLRDPELIRQICVKEFDSFVDHALFLPDSSDPVWNRNVFFLKGNDWRDMRATLNPAFTSSKMKMMFVLMNECSHDFIDWMSKKVPISLEMRDVYLRFATNVYASIGFGIKIDALRNQDDEFYKVGKSLLDFDGLKSMKFFGYAFSPTLMKMLKVSFIDEKSTNFFVNLVKDNIRYREETGLVRMDMIHLLKEAQKGKLNNEQEDDSNCPISKLAWRSNMSFTDEDIVSQVVTFFMAGLEVVASLLSNLSHALATNPDVQSKLADEIAKTLEECDGEITYQSLMGMKYMDMVVSEAVRLWPSTAYFNRKAVKPFTIQPELPGEEPLHLEPESQLWIPIYAMHRDPKYFPDPDKFDPERFNDENKHNIVPFSYLPFGAGPRICIALRFAVVEVKTLMFHLLSKFELHPTGKTHIPLTLSRSNITINSEHGYWLGLKPRQRTRV